jgi:hypothetical protein
MGAKAQFDADFGKFISELARADVKLRDFDATADKSSAKMERLANSLNGNKLLEQAAVAVNAIKRIEGGVAGLNNGELKRYGTLIDAATDKLIRQGREVPPALAQVKSALDQQRAALEGTAKAAGETQGILGGLGGAIGTGLGIGAGLGAFDLVTRSVGAMKDAIVETITEGNKLSQLRSAFESLQGGSAPAAVALDDLRQATRGLVTDLDLMQAANKASLLGLGEMGIKTDELASVAVRLGKAMGQDAAKSVDDLTTALARQSPQILDNLGIKVNLTDANEKYAATLGKTVEALTDEEKKFAFATAAMDAAREKAETLGEQQLTLSEHISKASNSLTNLQGGIGEAINKSTILIGVVDNVIDRVDAMTEAVGLVGKEFKGAFGPLGTIAANLVSAAGGAELFAKAITATVVPALTLANVQFRVYAGMLETINTFRQGATGEINDVSFGPKRTSDIQLADATFGQHKRAQEALAEQQKNAADEYIKAQDAALRKIEDGTRKGNAKLDQLAKERTERLNRLTGRDALIAAQQTVKDLAAVGGVSALTPAQAAKTFSQLFDAREIAKAIAPGLTGGFTGALEQLAKSPAVRNEVRQASAAIFKTLLDPSDLRRVLATSGASTLIGRELSQALSPLPDAMKPAIADTYALRKGLADVSIPLSVINERFDKATKKTNDWQASLRNVSQAFANLSQISGGALDGITGALGTVLGAADAAVSAVEALGDLFGSEKFSKSNAGAALTGGLAGMAAGPQFAALLGDNRSGAGNFLAGGVGGGASAFAATGGNPYAVAAGFILGGVSALIAANAKEKALVEEMDRSRKALLSQFESREDLIAQARRVGFSEHDLNFKILDNTDDANAYANAVNDLNAAFEREKRQADALSKSLGNVAKVNGVLSRQQFLDVRDALFRDASTSAPTPTDGGRIRNPGTIVGGPDDASGPRGGPRSDVAEAFARQQGESLLQGLRRVLEQPGALTPSLVTAVGQSLPAALAEFQRQGVSSIDALKTLQPLIDQFQQKAVLAGAGSTPGFDALNAQLAILKDERLGPMIERANGAGQALGALQNLGLQTQETFSGFATSISDTVAGMDLLSTDGQNAMRLIQQPLQNVWQLQKDFGYQVSESTQALLDNAEAAGLIGEKFRPAEERIAEGITSIVERLDLLIEGFTNGFPQAAIEGAGKAAKGIEDAFGKLKPIVRVDYDTKERHPLGDELRDELADGGKAGADLAMREIEARLAQQERWHRLRDGIETEATIGAGLAADAIEDAFSRLRIRVPIHYEGDPNDLRITYPEDPRRGDPRITIPLPSEPPPTTSSSSGVDAARAATTSSTRGAVYMDGREVGEVVLRHAGDILEFNGV